jgi:hypothetical protein
MVARRHERAEGWATRNQVQGKDGHGNNYHKKQQAPRGSINNTGAKTIISGCVLNRCGFRESARNMQFASRFSDTWPGTLFFSCCTGRNGMVFPEGRWISLAQVDFDGTNLSRIPDKKMQGCVLSLTNSV